MPTLQKIFTLDVTPEKFIDNCSDIELQEVLLLANARLNRMETTPALPTADCQLPATKTLPQPKTEKTAAKIKGWTPEEDAQLHELWPTHLGVEIADKLHREYKSVMARAAKLGLRKNNKRQIEPEPESPPPPPEEVKPSNKKTKERNTDCLGTEILRKL